MKPSADVWALVSRLVVCAFLAAAIGISIARCRRVSVAPLPFALTADEMLYLARVAETRADLNEHAHAKVGPEVQIHGSVMNWQPFDDAAPPYSDRVNHATLVVSGHAILTGLVPDGPVVLVVRGGELEVPCDHAASSAPARISCEVSVPPGDSFGLVWRAADERWHVVTSSPRPQ